MISKDKYLSKIENEFAIKKVLVIGDVMVDEYITGKVKRISPEAPVPVLDYSERRLEAGGASNVAHNMKALGAMVAVAGIAQNDKYGAWLRKHFEEIGISTNALVAEGIRPTTIKTRFATKGQQLLRVDNEDSSGINSETEDKILNYLRENIKNLDVVVMSDYRKGVFENPDFVKSIIKICNENNVLVSIDSKSKNIEAFENVDFVKPNNLELEAAVNIRITDDESFEAAGRKYLEMSKAKALVVTRGSKGISVFVNGNPRADFPAKDVQVFDVCGAGDTVISTISMAMSSGLTLEESVQLANLAAGVVITKVGTVAVHNYELIKAVNEEE